jgi:ABC-type branched-subunit amino acid transport system substrate-binding protein
MRRGGLNVLVGLVALVMVAGACSNSKTSGQGTQTKKPLLIGASLPLTGDFSEPGTAAKQGYEVWQDTVNKSDGLLGRQVKLVIKDDASDQNTIVADYNRLISQDKVDLLLGSFSSLLNIPASAVAERNQKVYICPACGSPDMFNRGFQFIFFAQPATAIHQADQFSDWVTSLPAEQRPKTAAYPAQDDPFAAPVVDGIRQKLEAAGVQTVYNKIYPPDTANFDPIASAIKSSGAELIAQGSVFEDGVGLVRSLAKIGYSPKAMFQTTAPSLGAQYSNGVGTSNTEGIFYAVSWSPAADYPLNADFVKNYVAKFGGDPGAIPEDAADAFATAQVLQAAVKGVGSLDQKALADWIHSNTVDTILGPLSWNDAGAPQQAFILAQWQGGKSQIVLPQDVATSTQIVFPKPGWQS